MISDKSKFTSFKEKNVGHVTFRDYNKENVKGIGNIGNFPTIENISLVNSLKYNLLSISQLYNWLFFNLYIVWSFALLITKYFS